MITNELNRRRILQLLGGAGLVAVAGCASKGTSSSGASPAAGTIPEETAGPFPGDGSNGPDALTQDGVVRKDIRSSFGGASGTADGVPMTIRFTLADAATGASMHGAAVYVWHCDRDGRYSMYSEGATDANYLTAARNVLATSQVALTENVCNTVYATGGYEQSRSNMTQVSLATDMVFSDGPDLETPTVTGSVADGYVVSLPVRVA